MLRQQATILLQAILFHKLKTKIGENVVEQKLIAQQRNVL